MAEAIRVLTLIVVGHWRPKPLPPAGWKHEVVARIDADRRAALPAKYLPARQAWRDRRLMALIAHKIAASKGS